MKVFCFEEKDETRHESAKNGIFYRTGATHSNQRSFSLNEDATSDTKDRFKDDASVRNGDFCFAVTSLTA